MKTSLRVARVLALSLGLIAAATGFGGRAAVAGEAVQPAVGSAPFEGRLVFSIFRKGDEIGRHVIVFRRRGDVLEVTTRTRIAITAAFFTLYRFEHRSREEWRDGKLVALDARTDDNGEVVTVNARAVGGRLEINGGGRPLFAPGDVVPESLWSRAFLGHKTVMNPLDGAQSGLAVKAAGIDWIDAGGSSLRTERYVVSGTRNCELWFASNRLLAKMRFQVKDSSWIEFVLRSPVSRHLVDTADATFPNG
ncbi:MAG: DUF6134 family protein [Alphaproteobacteria bacterium]